MFKADGERKEFPLNKSEVVIGRKNTCDLRIPLSSVSRQHFKIEKDDNGKLMLRDLGSSNGTFYNDERVLEAELGAGDRIRVGPVTFVVVVDGKPETVEPVTTVLPEADAQAGEPAREETGESQSEKQKPKAIDTGHDMPAKVEEEAHSPTVTLDDADEDEDPISALESLSSADQSNEDEDDDKNTNEQDSGIPLLDDEDEKRQ